jgi:hypothetical protein
MFLMHFQGDTAGWGGKRTRAAEGMKTGRGYTGSLQLWIQPLECPKLLNYLADRQCQKQAMLLAGNP